MARHSPSGKTISATSSVAFSVTSHASESRICRQGMACCHSCALNGCASLFSQRTFPSPSSHQRSAVSAGMRWRRWISAAVKWVSPLFASPQSSEVRVLSGNRRCCCRAGCGRAHRPPAASACPATTKASSAAHERWRVAARSHPDFRLTLLYHG